jgi:hypothetical protein
LTKLDVLLKNQRSYKYQSSFFLFFALILFIDTKKRMAFKFIKNLYLVNLKKRLIKLNARKINHNYKSTNRLKDSIESRLLCL